MNRKIENVLFWSFFAGILFFHALALSTTLNVFNSALNVEEDPFMAMVLSTGFGLYFNLAVTMILLFALIYLYSVRKIAEEKPAHYLAFGFAFPLFLTSFLDAFNDFIHPLLVTYHMLVLMIPIIAIPLTFLAYLSDLPNVDTHEMQSPQVH